MTKAGLTKPSFIYCSMHIPQRKMIHTRDIANLTGCSDRNARKLLQSVRVALGKLSREYVSIEEFCIVTGIDESMVNSFINNETRDSYRK